MYHPRSSFSEAVGDPSGALPFIVQCHQVWQRQRESTRAFVKGTSTSIVRSRHGIGGLQKSLRGGWQVGDVEVEVQISGVHTGILWFAGVPSGVCLIICSEKVHSG